MGTDRPVPVSFFAMSIDRQNGQDVWSLLRAGCVHQERLVDQVVVIHGTIPLDDLYFELKPHSSNLGEVDYESLVGGKPQTVRSNTGGGSLRFMALDNL